MVHCQHKQAFHGSEVSFFNNVVFLLLLHKPASNGFMEQNCVDLDKKARENPFVTSETSLSARVSLTERCLPWWKALFIFLSWTTLTSCREGICWWSPLRLVDCVKYAEDVWETDIFCLTGMIQELKPSKQTDSRMTLLTHRSWPLPWNNREIAHIKQTISASAFVTPDTSLNFKSLTF